MAAGGSLISMPVLILLGLPPAAANGTNRVAILVQNVTAAVSFRSRGYSDLKLSLSLALCTVPGAIAGAVFAIEIDPVLFKRILAGVLIGALILILTKPDTSEEKKQRRRHLVTAHIAAVFAGFYGGFIQAGVGFLVMPILHRLLCLDLVRVNMHKVFIIGAFNVPALLVFALHGQVWWLEGCVLAIGNAVGGWLGAHTTMSRGEGAVRLVVCLAVIGMAIKLAFG
ncbi:MAG: sulfite exporter TauE/SafE family protein [bacterium]|nr:sulfite exporter TauE/SafE family protein [bacterium]